MWFQGKFKKNTAGFFGQARPKKNHTPGSGRTGSHASLSAGASESQGANLGRDRKRLTGEFGLFFLVGTPVVPFLTDFFGWEIWFPNKIDYRKKGTLILTSLLEELVEVDPPPPLGFFGLC